MACKLLFLLILLTSSLVAAQTPRVVDVPSRAGVTQRFLLLQTENAKAAVILFAGGDGGLQLAQAGTMKALRGNFLVRSRDLFSAQELAVAVIDAPSDRQNLSGFRDSAGHVADVKAVIAWLKTELKIPVWLVGTSRGTQSAAYVATQSAPADGGADGVVLTNARRFVSRLTLIKSLRRNARRLDNLGVLYDVAGHQLAQIGGYRTYLRIRAVALELLFHVSRTRNAAQFGVEPPQNRRRCAFGCKETQP